MDIGYARVSTGEQTLDLQLDARAKAGCGKVFTATASKVKTKRPFSMKAIADSRFGDKIIVWHQTCSHSSLLRLVIMVI